jgi:hypothetical protein
MQLLGGVQSYWLDVIEIYILLSLPECCVALHAKPTLKRLPNSLDKRNAISGVAALYL